MNGRKIADDAHARLPSIAVLIVNYGTAVLALDAIDSVLRQSIPGRMLQIHLVDNASPGDDARLLADAIAMRGWQDRVTLWAERENHGFGRGNNVVLSALARQPDPPAYVLLLNPDAQLEDDALPRLAACLDARPDVAGVGPALSKPDGRPISAAFRFPDALSEFETAACFGPVSRLLDRHKIALDPGHPEGPVDWVAGAAVLFRLADLRAVGFFDPAFFLYYEEVDLMRRLRAAGRGIWFLPSARARHVEGAATGVSGSLAKRRPAYWFHSWHIYHRHAVGRPRALLRALAHLAGTAVSLLQTGLRRAPPRLTDGYLRDFWTLAVLPLLRPEVPR